MSWITGYKSKPSTSAEDPREVKRKKLEQERKARQERAESRVKLQKQIQAAAQSQEEANQALQDFLSLDPDIFEHGAEGVNLDEEEINTILEESATMENFEDENGTDGSKAMEQLLAVKCPFIKDDIDFWFSQFEGQLEVIEIKSQWVKRIALQRFLPPEIQLQVKSLLKLLKTQAGDDIYKRLKLKLIHIYGDKPEDAYIRAKNRVMTDKPSQLGEQLIDDLCICDVKLSSGCCARLIWGMYQERIPIIIRNHIAQMKFDKDTYAKVFEASDQVWASNQGTEPAVAAVTADPEVSALNKAKNKNKPNQRGQNRGGQRNQNNQSQGNQGSQNQNAQNQTSQGQSKPTPKPPVNEEKLCKIHAKWRENASFCAAPWACKMKNIYKAPQ